MGDLNRARHVAFVAGKSSVLRKVQKAGVVVYKRMNCDPFFTEDEKYGARIAVRCLMAELHVYDEFFDFLNQEEES